MFESSLFLFRSFLNFRIFRKPLVHFFHNYWSFLIRIINCKTFNELILFELFPNWSSFAIFNMYARNFIPIIGYLNLVIWKLSFSSSSSDYSSTPKFRFFEIGYVSKIFTFLSQCLSPQHMTLVLPIFTPLLVIALSLYFPVNPCCLKNYVILFRFSSSSCSGGTGSSYSKCPRV